MPSSRTPAATVPTFLLRRLYRPGPRPARSRCRGVEHSLRQHHRVRRPSPVPGDARNRETVDRRLVRWNALAMVVRATESPRTGRTSPATPRTPTCSRSVHTFSAPPGRGSGVLPAHSAPALRPRLLEGRLSETLTTTAGSRRRGLSSYCHPYLMPSSGSFRPARWDSAAPGHLSGRFLRTCTFAALLATAGARCGPSWATARWTTGSAGRSVAGRARGLGQPHRRGPTATATPGRPGARQRLHRPGNWRSVPGAGWRVIKLLWGYGLGPAVARDREGSSSSGCTKRSTASCSSTPPPRAVQTAKFFNKYPELQALVPTCSDADFDRSSAAVTIPSRFTPPTRGGALNRQPRHPGPDRKARAWALGRARWAATAKQLEANAPAGLPRRFHLPLADADVMACASTAGRTARAELLHARRQALGGYLPAPSAGVRRWPPRPLARAARFLEGSPRPARNPPRLVFVAMLAQLFARTPTWGDIWCRSWPRSAHLRYAGAVRQVAIYSWSASGTSGRRTNCSTKGSRDGQILEAGSPRPAPWLVDRGRHQLSTHRLPMLPVFHFLLQLRFKRVGD